MDMKQIKSLYVTLLYRWTGTRRKELHRLATVVNDSNDAVIMHDLDGKILTWNRGAKEIYGYTEVEVLGKNVREIVAEPDREALLTMIRKIKEGEIVKSFELQRVAKDGRILDIWLTATLLSDEKGKPVAIATTERDITERKKKEISLIERVKELHRLATVVNDSNDAVIMHDLDGKILTWNHGAKEIYGYTEVEVLGKNVREIVAEPDREALLTMIRKIKEGEIVKSFELQRVAKDGRILDIWLTATLLSDEKGKPVAIATTERDITERKRLQKEIQQFNKDLQQQVAERTKELSDSTLALLNLVDDLNESTRNITVTNKSLETVNKELEAFSYSVSHDLRAPLRSIDGFSSALLEDYEDKLDKEGKNYLKRIRRATQNMGQLIDDLLNLSRVAQFEFNLELIDLSKILRTLAESHLQQEPTRNVDLIIQGNIVIRCDKRLMQIALTNLLDNAWKFTGKQKNPQLNSG